MIRNPYPDHIYSQGGEVKRIIEVTLDDIKKITSQVGLIIKKSRKTHFTIKTNYILQKPDTQLFHITLDNLRGILHVDIKHNNAVGSILYLST